MTGPVFVDTSVLVYRRDASGAPKQARAQQWIALLARRHAGGLTFQTPAVDFPRRDSIILFGPAARGLPGKRPSCMCWFAT